jgi:hypothetical protein
VHDELGPGAGFDAREGGQRHALALGVAHVEEAKEEL